MPSGIYIRTEQTKKNISKSRKRWIKENPEKAHIYAIMGGKSNNGKGLKKAWKNNRERMLIVCSKAGKIGGKIGGKTTMQKQQKLHPSPIELIIRSYLEGLNIKYRPNVWFGRKEADIVIDKCKFIIECDGWMHDTYKNVKKNDKFKTKLFNKLGYKVLRLKGIEIRNKSFENKLEEILRKLY